MNLPASSDIPDVLRTVAGGVEVRSPWRRYLEKISIRPDPRMPHDNQAATERGIPPDAVIVRIASRYFMGEHVNGDNHMGDPRTLEIGREVTRKSSLEAGGLHEVSFRTAATG